MADGSSKNKKSYWDIKDVIYQLESSGGTDPNRLVPNEYGALGSYQIRPIAYQDVQSIYPKKWQGKSFREVALDDALAREAASDYLSIIQKYYEQHNLAPTMEALLAGYHSGMGNVVKGKVGPKGIEYVSRARALMGLDPEQ